MWVTTFLKVNQTKVKGGCQSERKVVTHDSESDLPLGSYIQFHFAKAQEAYEFKNSLISQQKTIRSQMSLCLLKCTLGQAA